MRAGEGKLGLAHSHQGKWQLGVAGCAHHSRDRDALFYGFVTTKRVGSRIEAYRS